MKYHYIILVEKSLGTQFSTTKINNNNISVRSCP